ncbi:TetR/AcrR family transcriptional regulator [Rhodococcus phenolicus]|uniref:TetR/AcrR family transcriptional regulator n=1 Tax=Rhodococcus phenolicus TaxID=263849 RepID=UPI0008295C44|nr:TetR/AcrR family transcriptional regulator [Rhodococcus phenolicus]
MSTHLPRPGRRRARRDGRTRTRILDAAETLFATNGFDATATATIAATADVPKGLIFYYFPTKEAILDTLVAERMPAEPITDVTALVEPGDPAASLVNLDTALNLRDHRSPVLRVIIWREAAGHPDVRTHLHRLRSNLHDVTMRLLQASAPGPVQPGTLRACATTWVSAMFSAASIDRLLDLDGPARNREDLRTVARVVAAGMTGMGTVSFG